MVSCAMNLGLLCGSYAPPNIEEMDARSFKIRENGIYISDGRIYGDINDFVVTLGPISESCKRHLLGSSAEEFVANIFYRCTRFELLNNMFHSFLAEEIVHSKHLFSKINKNRHLSESLSAWAKNWLEAENSMNFRNGGRRSCVPFGGTGKFFSGMMTDETFEDIKSDDAIAKDVKRNKQNLYSIFGWNKCLNNSAVYKGELLNNIIGDIELSHEKREEILEKYGAFLEAIVKRMYGVLGRGVPVVGHLRGLKKLHAIYHENAEESLTYLCKVLSADDTLCKRKAYEKQKCEASFAIKFCRAFLNAIETEDFSLDETGKKSLQKLVNKYCDFYKENFKRVLEKSHKYHQRKEVLDAKIEEARALPIPSIRVLNTSGDKCIDSILHTYQTLKRCPPDQLLLMFPNLDLASF